MHLLEHHGDTDQHGQEGMEMKPSILVYRDLWQGFMRIQKIVDEAHDTSESMVEAYFNLCNLIDRIVPANVKREKLK